jgi:dynein light intermediate chain 1, cytosolic
MEAFSGSSVKPNLEEDVLEKLPLKEGVLENNYGIPFVILCNKTDMINSCISQIFKERAIEYVGHALRKYAMSYGAGLIYTSCKTSENMQGQQQNIDLFYEYLLHLLYQFPFKYKSEGTIPDALFIPIGYDSKDTLMAQYGGLETRDNSYIDEIPKFETKKKVPMPFPSLI